MGRKGRVFHQEKQEFILNQNKNNEKWNVNVSRFWRIFEKKKRLKGIEIFMSCGTLLRAWIEIP